MIKISNIAVPLIVLAVALNSCCTIKSGCDCLHLTPIIQYKDFITYGRDSAKLTIGFEDCSGNIGANEEGEFNLRMTYYEMVEGNWNRIDLSDSVGFNYHIPELVVNGKYKQIAGDIEVSMPIYRDNSSLNSDTIKFDILLLNKQGYPSNTVTTPTIVVRK